MAEADVCVYGLGYIGLPTAAILAESGHQVTGYDVDENLLSALADGVVEIEENGLGDLVRETLDSGALSLSETPVPASHHMICVQTPLDSRRQCADLERVEAAAADVAEHLTPDATVVLESTVPPGTTADVVGPILAEAGYVPGEDVELVFSPETVLPGDIIAELRGNDRIVGGVDRASTRAGRRLYESFVEGDIYETDATTAEMTKLTQNTFRDVNIAFANELAKVARDHGVDSGELVRLANTHPRVTVHDPGPGVGGHCIPIDPWFLVEDSEQGALIERARSVNDAMASYVVELLGTELGSLADETVGVLGIAYKGDVADARESPGLRIVERLRDAGATVRVNDPHVSDPSLDLVPLDDLVEEVSGAIVATDHERYATYSPPRAEAQDPAVVEDGSGKVVVDARRVLDADQWTAAGYRVIRL